MLELLQKGKAYEGAHWERKAGISAEFSSVCEPGCILIFIHNIRSTFSSSVHGPLTWSCRDWCLLFDHLVPELARLLQTSGSPAGVRSKWKRGLSLVTENRACQPAGRQEPSAGWRWQMKGWWDADVIPSRGWQVGCSRLCASVQCGCRCPWIPSKDKNMPNRHRLL